MGQLRKFNTENEDLNHVSFIQIENRTIFGQNYEILAIMVRLKALAFFKAIEAGLNGLEQGKFYLISESAQLTPSSGKFRIPDDHYD